MKKGSNVMDKLRSKIQQAKSAIIDIKNQRAANVYENKASTSIPPFPNYAISESISEVFKEIKITTIKELNVYNPLIEESEEFTPNITVNTSDNHSYLNAFVNSLQFYSMYDFPTSKLENFEEDIEMTVAELNLFKAVSAELDFANENMAKYNYSIATLQKLKTAVHSVGMKRIKDALTCLKSAKEDDPNNRSLAYVISQILYFKVQNGGSESLPEARAEAKKSCLYSDNCDAHQLRQYRYVYVLQECVHSPKRAIELMREFYLLNPESMTEGNGLGAHQGVHFKTWILLSTLNAELLTTFEIESLITISSMATSGVCFYLNIMRPVILKRLENEKDLSIQKLIKLEEMLNVSYENYKGIAATVEQGYDEEFNLTPSSEHLWTIEQRYTSLLLKATKFPEFDEVYLYTSLDAKRYSTEAYPNKAMAALGLANVNYWQVWSIAIADNEGKGASRTFPVNRMALHAEIYKKFDEILKDLEAYEESIIPPEKWELIEKYMPEYEYQIFPHVAVGPGAFLAPSNPYYLNFYRAWVKERPCGPLPSKILKEYAEKGHFIDVDEVIAAFEGAVRVIVDDVHGLKVRAKAALKLCLLDSDGHKSEKVKDMIRDGHFNDYWWLYFIALPLAVLTFYMVLGSGSGGGGFLTLLVIILIVGGIGYGLYIFNKEGEDSTSNDKNDKVDDKENNK